MEEKAVVQLRPSPPAPPSGGKGGAPYGGSIDDSPVYVGGATRLPIDRISRLGLIKLITTRMKTLSDVPLEVSLIDNNVSVYKKVLAEIVSGKCPLCEQIEGHVVSTKAIRYYPLEFHEDIEQAKANILR